MLQSVKKPSGFGLVATMILPALAQGGGSVLERRNANATTNAVCGTQFSWMDNTAGESPCLVAAILAGACATGAWNIPALGPGQQYNPPIATTANYCGCSWAVYNLLNACTACQSNTAVENWSPYSQSCGSFLTNSYFPTDKVIVPNNTLLPFWAATDPTTWLDARFDVDQAQSKNNEGKADINLSKSQSSSSPTPHKSSNTGAIAGGVIGGLAVAVIAAVIFLLMRRRRRRLRARIRSLLDPLPQTVHGRSLSDTSQLTQKMGDPLVYLPESRQTASPPSVYTASTFRTHAVSPSISSLPYDVSIITGPASNAPSPPPPQVMMSPIGGSMAPLDNLENVIVPYTVAAPASDAPADRKRADGNLYPIFENQNFQPSPSNTQSTPPRGRYNPPTYNESIASGDASVMRNVSSSAGSIDQKGRTHGHQNSSDTVESHSTTITHANLNRHNRPVSGSVGGLDDMGSNLGFASPPSVMGINSPIGPGTNVLSADGSVIVGDDVA